MKFKIEAPAKINWFLSVLNRRDDGYHNIVSLMQCVDLYDYLTFEESDRIELSADIDGLPAENNLVFRAAKLMLSASGKKAGAVIQLEKNIPIAAGLGGGSSDAAAALVGLNILWNIGFDSARLRELAADIGSDVPFFIDSCFAVAEGRGEIITNMNNAREVPILLVNPGIPVSAAWAYKFWQIGLTKKHIDIKLFCQSLDRIEFDALQRYHENALEAKVIEAHPEIGRIKDMLIDAGAAMSAMSGSGSTVFGVFRTIDEAQLASAHMHRYWCRAVKTLSVRR